MSKTPLRTKSLIKSFEEGTIQGSQSTDFTDSKRESYRSAPSGLTKKLVQEYEVKSPEDGSVVAPFKVTAVTKKEEEEEGEDGEKKKKAKRVLIVFAHWERQSFNGALLDAAVNQLTEEGHEVEVSDLYRQSFNPLPSKNDIQDGPRNPDHFSYPAEMGLAYERGTISPDITAEQEKLLKADLVIFQFPMNWLNVPAILKGYFDRVLCQKFAYDFGDWFDKGINFKGKKVILSFTTGSPESSYTPEGFMGDINVILWPLQNGILRFCGWDVLTANICFSAIYSSDETRKTMIDGWRDRLKNIWMEQPIRFIPIDNFDPATGRLTEKVIEKLTSTMTLPVGQHAGRQVAPASMYIPQKTQENQI